MNDFENPVVAANHAFVQMKRMKECYQHDISVIDGAIADLYHDLEELDKLDAYTGYLYGKRFWELNRARRKLKEQNEQIKSLERFFNLRSSIDNMDRAMLKAEREMPRAGKRKTRQNDLLVSGKIQLKCGINI